MNTKILAPMYQVYCWECGASLRVHKNNEGSYIYCAIPVCPEVDKKYEIPKIELKPYKPEG